MEKLIGFELRAPPHAQIRCAMIVPIEPPLLSRYDGVKMSTFHDFTKVLHLLGA